jgi:hypothetical protein
MRSGLMSNVVNTASSWTQRLVSQFMKSKDTAWTLEGNSMDLLLVAVVCPATTS